jgi:hypothetical protein
MQVFLAGGVEFRAESLDYRVMQVAPVQLSGGGARCAGTVQFGAPVLSLLWGAGCSALPAAATATFAGQFVWSARHLLEPRPPDCPEGPVSAVSALDADDFLAVNQELGQPEAVHVVEAPA